MNLDDHIIERLTREAAVLARLELHEVDPDAHFVRDLGLSSFDLLSLLAFAEKTFATRFPDEQLSELTTLNRVKEAVRIYWGLHGETRG